MNKILKILVEICRIFLGAVFTFSGFVKAVDPWGSAYKIHDYLIAFELDAYDFIALPAAFFQSAVEFGVGVCLLLGVYRYFNALLSLLIMLFMTPLTLWVALKNPVTDCGCFGDALVISNWQTFYKNIFLLIAAILVTTNHRLMLALFTNKSYRRVSVWIYLFIVGLSLYCYQYLPVLDFRPYKVGVNISQSMSIPEDAEQPVFESILIYSKDGKQKSFTLENYPQNDSTWTFVDSRTSLIKKGYVPPIHDFSITTDTDEDITEVVLEDPSYTFLLIANNLDAANDANVEKINEIYDFAVANNYHFYTLTSSPSDKIKKWIDNTGAEYPFCTTDDITLKTIIRSNPGLLLLKNGVIVNKWPNTKLPSGSDLSKPLEETDLGKIREVRNGWTISSVTLILSVPLLVLFLGDFFLIRRKRRLLERRNN
jgi:uncharacterized membrane protein YphA (DoxX/SURF4 family)